MNSGFFEKIRNDIAFRIKFFLRLALAVNFAYSIFLFVASRFSYSRWFLVMSVYYGLLSVARIILFLQIKTEKNMRSRIKTMRGYGWFLLLLNLVISAMIFILIYGERNIKYHEIYVIALATYTFSALTVAIINIIKYLKKNDHVYFCVKATSLVTASVSIVTLTNTMLATFGEHNTLLRSIVLPSLGGVVSVVIIASAILMIRKANLDLRILKYEKK